MSDLTTRQCRFVDAYKGNATQAALEAGFSPRSARQHATRMLSNAAIQAAISVRQAEDSHRLQIERHDVIAGLLEAFAMANEMREPAAMVSAARELGRLMGFYAADRRQVEVVAARGDDRRHWEAMSDTELAGLVAANAATAAAP